MQPFRYSPPRRFQPALLASLITAALLPSGAQALDLATSPVYKADYPDAGAGYVVPNIIFSLDNSAFTKGQTITINGKTRPATDVMTGMLSEAFKDKNAFPDGSFRFTWQTMRNGCNSDASLGVMQDLNDITRNAFVSYLDRFDSCSWRTTSQEITNHAYYYMANPIDINSPWALKPGVTGAPYLACRRNYHFILSGNAYHDYEDYHTTPGPHRPYIIRSLTGSVRLPDDKRWFGTQPEGESQWYDQSRAYGGVAGAIANGRHLGAISDEAMAAWAPLQYFEPKYDRKAPAEKPTNEPWTLPHNYP
ncbi:MAG: hypothetical protein EON54_25410, partial [Alcaligenaceae bacterium]